MPTSKEESRIIADDEDTVTVLVIPEPDEPFMELAYGTPLTEEEAAEIIKGKLG